jgi:transposase
MKVSIGVDPHKASLAVAAVDEAKGELLERASFPQNRKGLRALERALERWAKRFHERRWALENAGGLGRHLAGRLTAAGESVVDVPPKLSARVRVLSTGNARKNDGLDALATALWPPRATSAWRRSIPRSPLSAAPAFREARGPGCRAHQSAQPPARASTRPRARRDSRDAPADRAVRILRGIRPQEGSSSRVRRRLASEVLRLGSGRWIERSPTSTSASNPR